MSSTTGADKTHIVCTPDVLGGKPRIEGTRIRVQDVYEWHELQGKSPDEIVSSFPQLTMADVYAALAYFWDHREQMLDQMRQQDETVEKLKSRFPSKLPERLRSLPGDNAVSS